MAIMRYGKASTLVCDSNSYIMTDYGSVRLPAEIDREYKSVRWRKNREIDMRFKRARALAQWERLLHQRIYDYFRAHPDAPDDDVHKIPVPTLEEGAQRIEAQKLRNELAEIVFKHTTRAGEYSKWWEFVPAIGDKNGSAS